jgi:hypothetical protein
MQGFKVVVLQKESEKGRIGVRKWCENDAEVMRSVKMNNRASDPSAVLSWECVLIG